MGEILHLQAIYWSFKYKYMSHMSWVTSNIFAALFLSKEFLLPYKLVGLSVIWTDDLLLTVQSVLPTELSTQRWIALVSAIVHMLQLPQNHQKITILATI